MQMAQTRAWGLECGCIGSLGLVGVLQTGVLGWSWVGQWLMILECDALSRATENFFFGNWHAIDSSQCILITSFSIELSNIMREFPGGHGHINPSVWHLTLGREVPHPHFPLLRDYRGCASRIGVPNPRQATRPRCLWRSLDHQ